MGRAARRRERTRVEAPEPRQMVTGEQPLPLAVQAPAVTTQPVQPEPAETAAAEDLLRQLRRRHRQAVRLSSEIDDLVREAVASGASFADVGAALEVSRQAARQRYLRDA